MSTVKAGDEKWADAGTSDHMLCLTSVKGHPGVSIILMADQDGVVYKISVVSSKLMSTFHVTASSSNSNWTDVEMTFGKADEQKDDHLNSEDKYGRDFVYLSKHLTVKYGPTGEEKHVMHGQDEDDYYDQYGLTGFTIQN